MKFLFLTLSMVLILFSCQKEEILPVGQYGGEQFLMDVQTDGINFTWGCASGESKIIPRIVNNSFEIEGTYTRGMGIIPADPALWPKPQKAIYYGTMKGKVITVKAKLVNQNQDLGTFKATLGQKEKIFYCL